jgi:hypothetical protein
MRSNHKKILGAVAVAGLVAATGSAFTGTGLTRTAPAAQFVGGTVSQAVTGATLSQIQYAFSDGTNTAVNGITLTFAAGADGKDVSVATTGGSGGTFTCTAVASNASTCAFAPTTDEDGYTGLDSLAVTVS